VEYLRQNGIDVSVGYLEEIIKGNFEEFWERVKIGKSYSLELHPVALFSF